MKKFLVLSAAAIIALFSFVGCSEAKNGVSQAEKLATDAVETVSEDVKDMVDSTDGDVKDDDGFIGNND